MGGLLHTVTVETFYWLGEEHRGLAGMRCDLAAAAADLEHLAEFLRAVGGGVCAVEESPQEAALHREARRWAERLGRVAKEMRAAVEADV